MKILIVSDLHAVNSIPASGVAPSLISFSSTKRTAAADPLIGLKDLLARQLIQPPEMLICAGDLADKADAHAITQVWSELTRAAQDYSIPYMFATCGNHDVDSRHKHNKFDPRGFLKSLNPAFPNPQVQKSELPHLSYWADNFSIVETDKWRVLNINSCAYHGYGEQSEPELLRGRISDYTLDAIDAQLTQAVKKAPGRTNICLFHHHLRDVSTDEFEDKSEMAGANRLISLLSRSDLGEWLVLHGHRHRSGLYYAGGNSSPIVLSCASFSATRNGDETNPCPNQFYEVEIEPTQVAGYAKIKGTLKVWNWTPGSGWQSTISIPGGLPVKSGFGYRGDLHNFCDALCQEAIKLGRITWDHAVSQFSELRYFMPDDLDSLERIISTYPNVVVSRDGTSIREIVRAA